MTETIEKANARRIAEIHTVLLGVKGSEDTGVVGQIRSIADQVREINGSVRANTAWRKALIWLIGSTITGLIVILNRIL